MTSFKNLIASYPMPGGLLRIMPYILARKPGSEDDPSYETLWVEFSEAEPMEMGPQPPIDRRQRLDCFRSLPELEIVFKGKPALTNRAVCVRYKGGTILKQKIDNGWLWTVIPPNL